MPRQIHATATVIPDRIAPCARLDGVRHVRNRRRSLRSLVGRVSAIVRSLARDASRRLCARQHGGEQRSGSTRIRLAAGSTRTTVVDGWRRQRAGTAWGRAQAPAQPRHAGSDLRRGGVHSVPARRQWTVARPFDWWLTPRRAVCAQPPVLALVPCPRPAPLCRRHPPPRSRWQPQWH